MDYAEYKEHCRRNGIEAQNEFKFNEHRKIVGKASSRPRTRADFRRTDDGSDDVMLTMTAVAILSSDDSTSNDSSSSDSGGSSD